MEYQQERKNRMRIGFDAVGGEPLQLRWNLEIKYCLYESILNKKGFGQSKRGFREVVIH